MPQVHSTAPTNSDVGVSSSGKAKPEGIDALFASILAEEQSSDTAEIKADLDIANQYIDQIGKLINEPIEEEFTTSPEELLQQIGHSVSVSAELDKAPTQRIPLSGENLPLEDVSAEMIADVAEDVSATELPLAVVTAGLEADSKVGLPNQSQAVAADAVEQVIPQRLASSQTAQQPVMTAAQYQAANRDVTKAPLNNPVVNGAELTAKPATSEVPVETSTLSVDAEAAEPELAKPALSIEPSQPKKDNKIMPVPQKNDGVQTAMTVDANEVEVQPVDDMLDAVDGMESVEKSTTKSSLQFGQTAPIFANNERVEARNEVPRFNVSLKQGLEQQVQMQDMIQRFAPVMKQQLTAMVSNGIGQAEIRLDPPELGHMMVRIQVQNDQTQVQFQVANPTAREMLEQATPRLRDMLAEQGMDLADSQVSYHDGGRDQQGNHNEGTGSGSGSQGYSDSMTDAEEVTLTNIAAEQSSGIDYYA